MNIKIAGLVLAISVVGGAGVGVIAHAVTTEEPAQAEPQKRLATGDFVLAPGAVGPVRAGMSKAEALATGYFKADVAPAVDGCVALPLAWKALYARAFDVQTVGNGEITSLGVRTKKATTADGIGVGSSYDKVRAAYPEESLVEAGYSQSGVRVFDSENGSWIGFLFDSSVDKISGSSPVTFIEVTKGAEPGLMRDGC